MKVMSKNLQIHLIAIAKDYPSPFSSGLKINNQGKITTTTRKCLGKCMKPEPSEAKKKQSIKTGFNFTSQRFSNKWRNLL